MGRQRGKEGRKREYGNNRMRSCKKQTKTNSDVVETIQIKGQHGRKEYSKNEDSQREERGKPREIR